MANLTKVGTSLLDMEAISNYLNVASGFMKKTDIATDTSKVNGIAAKDIAICGRAPDGEENNARRRVDSTYFLLDGQGNRHAYSEFMLQTRGNTMAQHSHDMGARFSDELQRLRDEMVQLRAELARRGYVQAYKPYAGFYDRFDGIHKNHLGLFTKVITDSQGLNAASTLNVNDEAFDSISPGDHLLVYSKDRDRYELAKVDSKGKDHRSIMLSSQLSWLPKAQDEIYKSYGVVSDNCFYFGEVTTDYEQIQKIYSTGLDDDTYRTSSPLKIKDNDAGYAYTVRIPSYLQGKLLKSIEIMVHRHGTPAPLKCYLIREKSLGAFQNPLQAREQGLIVGESKPLTVDASKGTHIISFDMQNPYRDNNERINIANPHNYPLLEDKDTINDNGVVTNRVRYAIIITTEGITPLDNVNYYDIAAVTNGKGADLQTNNTLYTYQQVETGSVRKATKTSDTLNEADIYYTLNMVDTLEEVFIANDKGMYSAHFTSQDSMASHFRVTMRVGREGMYHIENQTGYCSAGAKISFNVDSKEKYQADLSNIGNKPLVIGKTICYATKSTMDQNRFNIKDAAYIEKGDKIYPVGYSVRVKAKLIEWDKATNRYVTKDSGNYAATLTNVIEDGAYERSTSSDRLVYEADFAGKRFNDFEFEVYWEASSTKTRGAIIGGIEDKTSTGKILAGRIYDVVATVSDKYVPAANT